MAQGSPATSGQTCPKGFENVAKWCQIMTGFFPVNKMWVCIVSKMLDHKALAVPGRKSCRLYTLILILMVLYCQANEPASSRLAPSTQGQNGCQNQGEQPAWTQGLLIFAENRAHCQIYWLFFGFSYESLLWKRIFSFFKCLSLEEKLNWDLFRDKPMSAWVSLNTYCTVTTVKM